MTTLDESNLLAGWSIWSGTPGWPSKDVWTWVPLRYGDDEFYRLSLLQLARMQERNERRYGA